MLDAATSVEQLMAFVAHLNVDAEIIVGLEEFDDLLAKVVDVDHNSVKSCLF